MKRGKSGWRTNLTKAKKISILYQEGYKLQDIDQNFDIGPDKEEIKEDSWCACKD